MDRKPADVCVVGHVTEDHIRITGRPERIAPGGTVYYAAVAYARLGLRCVAVTRCAAKDADRLLAEMRAAGIEVVVRPSAATTTFENHYDSPDLGHRLQRVRAVADPFAPEDIEGVAARAFHFGPLTAGDMPAVVWQRAAAVGARVALDAQGLLRRIAPDGVILHEFAATGAMLGGIAILKADRAEAAALTGESDPGPAAEALARAGIAEALVTQGAAGSHVFVLADGRMHRIRVYRPPRLVDVTGCGDTYLAGYLARRLAGSAPPTAGRFASALASVKAGHEGPFRGTAEDAVRRLALAAD